MAIKVNTEVNLSVIGSAIAGIIAVVAAFFTLKGDVKTQGSQIASLAQEVGELRRMHLQVAQVAQKNEEVLKAHSDTIDSVVKLAKINSTKLEATAVLAKNSSELLLATVAPAKITENQPKLQPAPVAVATGSPAPSKKNFTHLITQEKEVRPSNLLKKRVKKENKAEEVK